AGIALIRLTLASTGLMAPKLRNCDVCPRVGGPHHGPTPPVCGEKQRFLATPSPTAHTSGRTAKDFARRRQPYRSGRRAGRRDENFYPSTSDTAGSRSVAVEPPRLG